MRKWFKAGKSLVNYLRNLGVIEEANETICLKLTIL